MIEDRFLFFFNFICLVILFIYIPQLCLSMLNAGSTFRTNCIVFESIPDICQESTLLGQLSYSDYLLLHVFMLVQIHLFSSNVHCSRFQLLLRNHWTNLNQTCRKPIEKGIQDCSNERQCPLVMGRKPRTDKNGAK